MISPRFAVSACVVVALALAPTVIHTYVGVVASDGRSSATVPTILAGFTSSPTSRDVNWGQRALGSEDWFERRYVSGSDEVMLTVMRSYDLKQMYHHPELVVSYGSGYLSETVEQLDGVPVHVLTASDENPSTAVYALHYGDGFVADPLWFQVRVAGELLFSGRKPMTLLFARDVRGAKKGSFDTYPSARVLGAAITAFAKP